MFLRLVKLVIVLLFLNAVWRVGSAYWDFYRFRDGVQETAQFSAGKTDSDVHERVMQLARQAGLPVPEDAVRVRRDGQQTYIDVYYVRDIEIVPRAYVRPWPFSVNASAWAVKPELQPSSTK